MIFFWIALGALVFMSLRRRKDGEAWCCKEDSDAVKGVFVFIIFLCHASGYVPHNRELWSDAWAGFLGGLFGQLVVVMFLFFSGYGVAESIRCKGGEYIKDFPRRRILPVLINFDVAVLAFAVLALLVGRELTLGKFILALTGWETLGNSNWYIFAIILCYAITYVAALTTRRIALWSFIGVVIMTQIMSFFKEPYWYNTIMAFPLGMVFSGYRTKMDKWGSAIYYGTFFLMLSVFISLYAFRHHDWHGFVWNGMSMSFAIVVVLLMHKLRLDSSILRWAGRNVFPIYIYQRLPMIALTCFGVSSYPVLFIALSFMLTLTIAFAYPKFRYAV